MYMSVLMNKNKGNSPTKLLAIPLFNLIVHLMNA